MGYAAHMKWLLRYLVQGAVVVVPVALTVYVVFFLVTTIDGWVSVGVPGVGLLLTLGLITLLGFLTTSVVGTQLIALVEHALGRLPLVKVLYNAIKDLVGAFVGEKKSFNQPVAVKLPGQVGHLFGFATRDSIPFDGFDDQIAVYFPQSYNFAGNVLAVRREWVTPLKAPTSEVMAFILSGGVSAR